MIPSSTISLDYKQYIAQKLKEIENKHNIQILLAVESGSRAWGFPSKDSDFDVRFIYVRHLDDYLSIQEFKDVLEVDLEYDSYLKVPLDINSWDIRKTLRLACKSNPVLLEWLSSPIRYTANNEAVSALESFAKENANLEQVKLHYSRLMQNIWEQIKPNQTKVQVKHYCYALRPALALKWANTFETLPPMDIATLYEGLAHHLNLESEIHNLIALKADAKEKDSVPRNKKLDKFIESMAQLDYKREKGECKDICLKEGNRIFRGIVSVRN